MQDPELPRSDDLGLGRYLSALAKEVDAGVPERPVAADRPSRRRWLAVAAAAVLVVAGFVVFADDDPAKDVDTVGPADTTTSEVPDADEASLGEPVPGEWRAVDDPLGAADSHAELLWTGDELLGVYPQNGGNDVAIQIWDADLTEVRPAAPSGQLWRAFPTIVWTGDEVLVIGGSNGPGIEDPVLAYDPATDSWRTGTPPPGFEGPQSENATGDQGVWTGDEVLLTNAGLAYDPAADSWRALAPSPYPGALRVVGTPSGAFQWGNCVGAGDDACEADASAVSQGAIYDASTDSWAEASPKGEPTPGAEVLAVSAGGEVTVVSARTGRPTPEGNAAAFDLGSGTWRALPDPPLHAGGYSDLVATPLGLVLGGSNTATAVLGPGADEWRTLGDDPLIFTRGAFGLAGERIVVSGIGKTMVFQPRESLGPCAALTGNESVVGQTVVGAMPPGFRPSGPIWETSSDQGVDDDSTSTGLTQRFDDQTDRLITVAEINSYDPATVIADSHRNEPTQRIEVPYCRRTLDGYERSTRAASISSDPAGTVIAIQTSEYDAVVVRGDPSVTRDELLLVMGGLRG